MIKNKKIAIIGLGYVGLPLAVEFGKKYPTIGFDINIDRINQLKIGIDETGETSKKDIQGAIKLSFSDNLDDIKKCNVYIISVPTPIDNKNKPNLKILLSATKNVGKILSRGDIVVYESTVYPGCTEEDCVPILEKNSSLVYNKDFFCGYSPERINPGDTKRTLTKIIKITSGSNPKIAKIVDSLYDSIINAGTYLADSIRIAEAAKIIENCQRDINIAFANELSMLFDVMKIDANEVLDAASTKWNFMPYKPGLVGGHCIGVDPYYLTYKAKKIGYNTSLINQARKLNDDMPKYIINKLFMHFKLINKNFNELKFLILGITFKENCSDIRNSKVFDIYKQLISKNVSVEICDHCADPKEVYNEYKIKLRSLDNINDKYDCIIVAVGHKSFYKINIKKYRKDKNSIIFDVKNIYNNKEFMRL